LTNKQAIHRRSNTF